MPPKYRGSRGICGIIGNDAARFHEFTASVMGLDVPPGWEKRFLMGGDWCGARNELARMTVEEGFTHLWFMDDDHSFAPDLLTRLLAHDVPLVTPMCLTRTYPFQPVSYLEDGALDLASVPPEGLVQLHAGGAAGMLIHRSVLEAVPEPWFEYSDQSEDVLFCAKARDAGFTLYGDLGARLGHITTCVVIPAWTSEHGWMTGLNIGRDLKMTVPLTAYLLNHEITRIDVPLVAELPDGIEDDLDDEDPADELDDMLPDRPTREEMEALPTADDTPVTNPCSLCGKQASWRDVFGQWGCDAHPPGHAGWRDEEDALPHRPTLDEILADEASEPATNPCSLCGKQATWHDVFGQWGCDDHPPDHAKWRTHYERAEIWFKGEPDNRWFGRILRADGTIAVNFESGWIHEAQAIEILNGDYPGLDVFHIGDEFSDSGTRKGPPKRLWDRSAT